MMPEIAEEKEKCIQKLNQMQKYIPFLDFMIERINNRNNAISLESQLSKFQHIRSMIAEKNGKHRMEDLLKVEDVIQKVMAKLDYKIYQNTINYPSSPQLTEGIDSVDRAFDKMEEENAEQKKQQKSGENEAKTVSCSGSLTPASTTTTVSVSTAPSLPQTVVTTAIMTETMTNPVDLIMKRLKLSVDQTSKSHVNGEPKNQSTIKELMQMINVPEETLKGDNGGSSMETDLGKDLDGFDLPDPTPVPEPEVVKPHPAMSSPEKPAAPRDLLASSRQKLMMNVHKKNSTGEKPGRLETGNGTAGASDNKTTNDARTKSDTVPMNKDPRSEKSNGSVLSDQVLPDAEINSPVRRMSLDNGNKNIASPTGDVISKQKLRDKLSVDIAAVHKVPGKSVGGSLRTLKDLKKNSPFVEEELFKADKITSKLDQKSSEKLSNSKLNDKSSEKFGHKSSDKSDHKSREKGEYLKSSDKERSKSKERPDDSDKHKKEKSSHEGDLHKSKERHIKEADTQKRDEKSKSKERRRGRDKEKRKKSRHSEICANVVDLTIEGEGNAEEKAPKLEDLNDEELLTFVKENMSFLPNLSKLNPSELREIVRSGLGEKKNSLDDLTDIDSPEDAGDVSLDELSDGTLDLDDLTLKTTAENVEKPHPLAHVRVTGVGKDGVAKDVKPVNSKPDDVVELENIGDKTDAPSEEEPVDDEDFALKLIEAPVTTTGVPTCRKKSLLDLPLPKSSVEAADIPFLESVNEPVKTCIVNPKDPRHKSIFPASSAIPNRAYSGVVTTDMRPNIMPDGSQGPPITVRRPLLSPPAPVLSLPPNIHSNTMSPPNMNVGPIPPRMNLEPFPPPRPYNNNINRPPQTDTWQQQPNFHGQPRPGPRYSSYDPRYPPDPKDPRFRGLQIPVPGDLMNRNISCGANPPRSLPIPTQSPKSYAEYKQMKLVKEMKRQQELRNKKAPLDHVISESEAPQPTAKDLKVPEPPHKPTDQTARKADTDPKFTKTVPPVLSVAPVDPVEQKKIMDAKLRKSTEDMKIREEILRSKKQREEEEAKRRLSSERRVSTDSEELISPLDKLYQGETKPKTGRGYGLQNFKIPKRVREPTEPEVLKKLEILAAPEATELKTPSIVSKPETITKKPTSAPESETVTSKPDSKKPVCKPENEKSTSKQVNKPVVNKKESEKVCSEQTANKANKPKSESVTNKSKNEKQGNKSQPDKATGKPETKTKETDPSISSKPSSIDVNISRRNSISNGDKKRGVKSRKDDVPKKKPLEEKCSGEKGKVSEAKQKKNVPEVNKPCNKGTHFEKVVSTEQINTDNYIILDSWTPSDKEDVGVENVPEKARKKEAAEKNELTKRMEESEGKKKLEENDEGKKVKQAAMIGEQKRDGTKNEETKKAEACNEAKTDEKSGNELRKEKSEEAAKVQISEEKNVEKGEENIKAPDAAPQVTDKSCSNSQTAESKITPEEAIKSRQSEEITRELVEYYIRKSFENGQGRLLLAQSRLLEKKISSKKLKLFEKLLNSESDTSSSSSSSSKDSSEDGRKKKKASKKTKKRSRRRIKHLSTSESEEESEKETSKTKESVKEPETAEKQQETLDMGKKPEVAEPASEKIDEAGSSRLIPAVPEPPLVEAEGQPKRKPRGKKRRKPNQLLEQFLDENPEQQKQADGSRADTPVESEPKTKSKPKQKGKTELDRLHEDIRSMFISEGVVTATGQRMCRFLRENGGNMNNMDIAKESAKLVEEEKLKNVVNKEKDGDAKTRRAPREPKKARSRSVSSKGGSSRSQSLDTNASQERSKSRNEHMSSDDNNTVYSEFGTSDLESNDSVMSRQPIVVLRKIWKDDLERFGYAYKIPCVPSSWNRVRGRNVAKRGQGARFVSGSKIQTIKRKPNKVSHNLYLERNLRRVASLKKEGVKKRKRAKRTLLDVINNLPLKMSKMKHLQIYEKSKQTKRKYTRRKMMNSTVKKHESDSEGDQNSLLRISKIFHRTNMLEYSFDKSKILFECLICHNEMKEITKHYKTFHPESEVLISRLSPQEAEDAIADSLENNYDVTALDQACTLESIKQRVKSKLLDSNVFSCRMCKGGRYLDVNQFFVHVSTHTGEYRIKCPAEDCKTRSTSVENMRAHISYKHTKIRHSLYNKITEVFPLPNEYGHLYGYLCSKCHYVQTMRRHVEDHVNRFHSTDDDVNIIKIDMSGKAPKDAPPREAPSPTQRNTASPRTLPRTAKIIAKKNIEHEFCNEDDEEESRRSTRSSPVEESVTTDTPPREGEQKDVKRRKRKSEVDKLLEMQKELSPHRESSDSDDDPKMLKFGAFERSEEIEVVDVNALQENGSPPEQGDEDPLPPLQEIPKKRLKGLSKVEALTKALDKFSRKPPPKIRKVLKGALGSDSLVSVVKVGPLEAKRLPNMEILYECYIKGCVCTSPSIELFEKHIQITHGKSKWDGFCQTCNITVPAAGSKKFLRLRSAFQHLKAHERVEGGVDIDDDVDVTVVSSTDDDLDNAEDDVNESKITPDGGIELNPSSSNGDPLAAEAKETTSEVKVAYPARPLLRVRTIHELSSWRTADQPAATSQDTVQKIMPTSEQSAPETEIESTGADEDSMPMFTIKDVVSLQPTEPAPPGAPTKVLRLEDFSMQNIGENFVPKPHVVSGNPVMIRPITTPKITVRSANSNPLSAPIGHIAVVSSASSNAPVVFAQLPNISTSSSPIRIITPGTLPIKSVFVSANPTFTTTTNPRATPCLLAPKPLTITTNTQANISVKVNTETQTAVTKSIFERKTPMVAQTVLVTKPTFENARSSLNELQGVSVIKRATPPAQRLSVDSEEIEDEEPKMHRRTPAAVGAGKNVKNAQIYQEMLSKQKLRDLYKCMAVECSFTCSHENVFTQHIGLHEAQQRILSKKTSKVKKAFNWQQCAYCCEVIVQPGPALSQHILTEHGHCLYQCAFCFYRAISQTYVHLHQKLVHQQIIAERKGLILKCSPVPGLQSPANNAEKQTRRHFVRPYHCDKCGSKFFITQEFMEHLAKEHHTVTAYTCHICKNLCFKADRLVAHYRLHSYNTYQCSYCLHGTETQREMLFHLCNFHFSQPAYMYVRALSNNQKGNCNTLEALKVVSFDNDSFCSEAVNAGTDPTEVVSPDGSKGGERPSVVTENPLNISDEANEPMTPVIQELMSLEGGGKALSVESLLPNAQFSSEVDDNPEISSVLISSGVNTVSTSNPKDDREINVPLGQLSLEAIGMQKPQPEPAASPPNDTSTSEKSLKINEIIVNLHHRDKTGAEVKPASEPTMKTVPTILKHSITKTVPSAVHKMPPVPPTASSTRTMPKNVYPVKAKTPVTSQEGASQTSSADEVQKTLPMLYKHLSTPETPKAASVAALIRTSPSDATSAASGLIVRCNDDVLTKNKTLPCIRSVVSLHPSESGNPPLITNVMSLPSNEFDSSSSDNGSQDNLPLISDVRSLLTEPPANIPQKEKLQPPTIRSEDYHIDGENDNPQSEPEPDKTEEEEKAKVPEESKSTENKSETDDEIMIIDVNVSLNKKTKILIDLSDSEDEVPKKETDDSILKEMEKLRNKMADETDSLLFDEDSTNSEPVGTLKVNTTEKDESSAAQALLSPIEKAICSLNKTLQSETLKAQEQKEKEKESDVVVTEPEASAVEKTTPPETSPVQARRVSKESDRDEKEGQKTAIKAEKQKQPQTMDRSQKPQSGLSGKALYICGIGTCGFSADVDSELKDHLYVCDFSRETSLLTCPHCSKTFKTCPPYVDHLKLHGDKNYSCGLCGFSSGLETSVLRHLRIKHKCGPTKTLPREPPAPGQFAVYPKNYNPEKDNRFHNFETKGYSPGDESNLPLQAVYQKNVKCAICPYVTKVRSNMVRHLKIHVKSAQTEGVVIVPSTAPTNPVPCLDTKEKMFDKMTNLAASSQLAQAKEKTAIETLSPEEEAKLPIFIAEQQRYKCCSSDCNYFTIDDSMLTHHIKALHDELLSYSCPHCSVTSAVDFKHVALDKIGQHLRFHDSKLYRCAHCFYFHYHKHVVEKHVIEKHPDRRFYVHTVREPKVEQSNSEDEPPVNELKLWGCSFCDDFESSVRQNVLDHLTKVHNCKSKYKCVFCDMKSSQPSSFTPHFSLRHPGEKVSYVRSVKKVKSSNAEAIAAATAEPPKERFDTTPLWQRDAPRVRHIRGILIEEEEIKTKRSKRMSDDTETEVNASDTAITGDTYFCPLCTDKKKIFQSKSAESFRIHLYQELNYHQFACILCGKMFVDKRDFDKHHARAHPDKPPSVNQTKEDAEIKNCVEKVIAKQRDQMVSKTRRENSDMSPPAKKRKTQQKIGTEKTPEPSRSVLRKTPTTNRVTRSVSTGSDPEVIKAGKYEVDFACRHCRTKTADLHSLKVHIKVSHLKIGKWKCPYCNAAFQTEIAATKHCRNEHPNNAVQATMNTEVQKFELNDEFWCEVYGFEGGRILKDFTPKDFIKCKFCDYTNVVMLVKHHEKQHTLNCGHCDFACTDSNTMKSHNSAAHSGSDTIKPVSCFIHSCFYCSKEADNEKIITAHIEEQHKNLGIGKVRRIDSGKRRYRCTKCDFKADDVQVLAKHGEDIHNLSVLQYQTVNLLEYKICPERMEDSDVCEKCGKASCECFDSSVNPDSACDGSYSCPRCPFICQDTAELFDHFKVHLPKYSCGNCSRLFFTPLEIANHQEEAVHSKPYQFVDPPENALDELKGKMLVKRDGRWSTLGIKGVKRLMAEFDNAEPKKMKGMTARKSTTSSKKINTC